MIPSVFGRSLHCLAVYHVVVLNAVSKNAGQNDSPHQLSIYFLGNLWESGDIEEVPWPHLHLRPRCSRVPLKNRLNRKMMKSVNKENTSRRSNNTDTPNVLSCLGNSPYRESQPQAPKLSTREYQPRVDHASPRQAQ